VGGVFLGRRPFKYENMWLEVDGFCDLVNSFWNDLKCYWPLQFHLGKETEFFEN